MSPSGVEQLEDKKIWDQVNRDRRIRQGIQDPRDPLFCPHWKGYEYRIDLPSTNGFQKFMACSEERYRAVVHLSKPLPASIVEDSNHLHPAVTSPHRISCDLNS
jgi:hypothetical protein